MGQGLLRHRLRWYPNLLLSIRFLESLQEDEMDSSSRGRHSDRQGGVGRGGCTLARAKTAEFHRESLVLDRVRAGACYFSCFVATHTLFGSCGTKLG